MFCSHCGKTLEAGQEKCPHCGAPVGESLLSGHTSAQPRYLPTEQTGKPSSRYTPYTKTSYTGAQDAGGDVYERTAYRPVLTDAEVEPTQSAEAEDAEAAQTDAASDSAPETVRVPVSTSAAPADPLQKASLERLTDVPSDAPLPEEAAKIVGKELNLRVHPPKPIRKTGISPEVEKYMRRMEEAKSKTRRRADVEPDAAEPAEEALDSVDQAPAKRTFLPKRAPRDDAEPAAAPERARGGAKRWVLRSVAALAILLLIGGGVVYLAFKTQPKSQIPNVSNELLTQGITLMKTRESDAYRTEIINLFKQDQTGAAVLARQAQDAAEISALLPERAQENDGKLIEVLLGIQTAIDDATTTDALAYLTASDPSLTNLSTESQEKWDVIHNAILRLETADSMTQLKGILDGVTAQPTPAVAEPTPVPAESEYKTLSKGMKKNKQVKKMQARLAQLGWFNGEKDGDYGGITQSAVKQFQQAAGLEVTGIATPETQAAIYAENAPRTAAKATPAPDLDAQLAADVGVTADSGEYQNDVTDQAQAG